jgi:hypothetical protein
MPDRAARIIELKREVKELLTVAGQPLRYPRAAGGRGMRNGLLILMGLHYGIARGERRCG